LPVLAFLIPLTRAVRKTISAILAISADTVSATAYAQFLSQLSTPFIPSQSAAIGVLLTNTHFCLFNGATWSSMGITAGSVATSTEIRCGSTDEIPGGITTGGVRGAHAIHDLGVDTPWTAVVQTA